MTRFTLEHESFDTNRDRAKAFDTLFNLALEEPKINSYSLLLFFQNRSPMRIVQNNKPLKLTADGLTRTYIDEWIAEGKGTLVIQTSIHYSMNEVYPHRSVSGDGKMLFHYFSGKFGNGQLWNLVSETRNRKNNVPETVSNFFKRNNFNDVYEIIKVQNNDEEYGEEDEINYRNFDFSTYCDGKQVLTVRRTANGGEYHNVDEDIVSHYDTYNFLRNVANSLGQEMVEDE